MADRWRKAGRRVVCCDDEKLIAPLALKTTEGAVRQLHYRGRERIRKQLSGEEPLGDCVSTRTIPRVFGAPKPDSAVRKSHVLRRSAFTLVRALIWATAGGEQTARTSQSYSMSQSQSMRHRREGG